MYLVAKDSLGHPHHVRRVWADKRIWRYIGYNLMSRRSWHRGRDMLGLGCVLGRYLVKSLDRLLGAHVLLRRLYGIRPLKWRIV